MYPLRVHSKITITHTPNSLHHTSRSINSDSGQRVKFIETTDFGPETPARSHLGESLSRLEVEESSSVGPERGGMIGQRNRTKKLDSADRTKPAKIQVTDLRSSHSDKIVFLKVPITRTGMLPAANGMQSPFRINLSHQDLEVPVL